MRRPRWCVPALSCKPPCNTQHWLCLFDSALVLGFRVCCPLPGVCNSWVTHKRGHTGFAHSFVPPLAEGCSTSAPSAPAEKRRSPYWPSASITSFIIIKTPPRQRGHAQKLPSALIVITIAPRRRRRASHGASYMTCTRNNMRVGLRKYAPTKAVTLAATTTLLRHFVSRWAAEHVPLAAAAASPPRPTLHGA